MPASSISRPILLALAAAIVAATSVVVTEPATAATQSQWDTVAACESGNNWAISTGNGFYGGVQFTHFTWIGYGGGAYASNANLASKAVQIMIAERVLADQGKGAWPLCGTDLTPSAVITTVRSAARAQLSSSKLVVDGIMGPLTRAQMARHGIFLNTVLAIKALQARLRVPGDGIVMPVTTRAMQRWLNTH